MGLVYPIYSINISETFCGLVNQITFNFLVLLSYKCIYVQYVFTIFTIIKIVY